MDSIEESNENEEFYNSIFISNTETNPMNYPKSNYLNYNPKEFIEIITKYYKNLKTIYKNNEIISKNDFLVLKHLVSEGLKYCMSLFEQGYLEESKELIDLSPKIVNLLLLIFKQLIEEGNVSRDNIQILQYLFSLKLNTLENQFQIYFNLNLFSECEIILNELMKLQIQLNLPKTSIGICIFFQSVLRLCILLLNKTLKTI